MKTGIYTITNDADRTQRTLSLVATDYGATDYGTTATITVANSITPTSTSEPAGLTEQIPYPRGIPTLLGSMFFERAANNGMKTVLIIFLTTQLAYGNDEATLMYHAFMTLVFFTAIFGAIVSDSCLGKYNTIVLMYVLGLVGMVLLNLGALPDFYLPARALSIVALFVLALGTGCMKPCILAFGGDQFRVPEQLHLMSAYFSMVFFVLKVSSFVGTALTPMLRTDVKCFGQETCFLLAFGVSGVILAVSMLCFMVGKCTYVVRPSSGNILVQVIKCIGSALRNRFSNKRTKSMASANNLPNEHWLDNAGPAHSKQLIHDTKILLKVLVLYVPIPFYWALNEQTGSRWTLQASRMIGTVFGGYYTIKPDQMQIVMQVLLIAFIPFFETVIYPALARFGLRRPLHKIVLAMTLAGTAFLMAGYLETYVAADYAVLPTPDSCQLRVYNTWSHPLRVVVPQRGDVAGGSVVGNEHFIQRLDAMQSTVPMDAVNASTGGRSIVMQVQHQPLSFVLPLRAGQAVSYYHDGRNLTSFVDSPRKATSQRPKLRILVVLQPPPASNSAAADAVEGLPLTLYDMKANYVRYRRRTNSVEQFELSATQYALRIGERLVTDQLKLKQGSVSTLLVLQRPTANVGQNTTTGNDMLFDFNLVQLTSPNSVHMLWMMPQYALLAAGEAIIGVTGMLFTYAASPESMKTVMQACWLLTVALGHLIDVIIVGANFIDSQIFEFFTFAGIMFANIMLFMWLISRYRPLTFELEVVSSAADGKPHQQVSSMVAKLQPPARSDRASRA